MDKQYFFITGLPRSATAWLANYLSYGSIMCRHDGFRNLGDPSQLKKIFDDSPNPVCGNSDPANLFFMNALFFYFPQAKWVYIERDPMECEASWKKVAGDVDVKYYAHRAKALLKRKPDTLVIPFGELFHRADVIAEYISPEWECPLWRKQMLENFNVQLDFGRAANGIDMAALESISSHVEALQ